MPQTFPPSLCSDADLRALVALATADPGRASSQIDTLLVRHPGDARLHFLQGSLLAGAQDYSAARAAMRRAVELAPDYAIARFQLGLLLLTSGDARGAEETWAPLEKLPPAHALRLFSSGLRHLARDEWDACLRDLEDGIVRNSENAPLNRDMQMVMAEVRGRQKQPPAGAAVSSVGLLLQQAALKATKH